MAAPRSLVSLWLRLWDMMRADDWWDYKLAPAAAVAYATAVSLNLPVSGLWPAAVLVVAALIPAAAYVCVINDLTDRAEDRVAGKRNRFANASLRQCVAFVVGTIVAGLCFVGLWHADGLLLLLYLAIWLAFSLYSLPPFRLKSRGAPGLLADASGAHLFPALLAAVLTLRAAGAPLNALWLASVGIWSVCYGLRGIIWHQLSDLEHDRVAAVGTFANRHGPRMAYRVGTFVVFPVELLALALMLAGIGSSPWSLMFLLMYGYLAVQRMRQWSIPVVIVRPSPPYGQILMSEYYDTLFPVGLILGSAVTQPLGLAVLCIHVLVFRRRVQCTLAHLWRLAVADVHNARRLLRTTARRLYGFDSA